MPVKYTKAYIDAVQKMPQQIAHNFDRGNSPGKLVLSERLRHPVKQDRDEKTELPLTSSKNRTSTVSISQQELIRSQQQQIDQLREELEQFKKNGDRRKSNNYRHLWRALGQFFAQINSSSNHQPRFSLNQILFSYIGSFIGIATLAYLSIGAGYPLIAAPFGAAAVLVFAVPDAALAQPRNLIFGNLIGAVISVVMVVLFGSQPWVMALAVATAIKLMQLTKTLHPPGGAVALVGVMSKAEVSFIFTPVLVGSVILLFCTIAFNNLMPGRSYPKR